MPDLPGCVATGETVEVAEAEIREAIRFHIEGLKADGLPIPAPTSIADYVETYHSSPVRHFRGGGCMKLASAKPPKPTYDA